MAFDGKALNRLYDWWQVNGNPDIHYWLTYDGCLTFFRKGQLPSIARIERRENGTCVLNYDAKDDPFTEQERQELVKFVRVNNAKFNN
ncbi:hypothetical protein LOB46_04290 [Lactobacillus delbrueckii subsp. lactis]|uniref:hypothetical protein n=1 Tax=Lactobacillus delbrueckii TaxID=1584 RepID=UPI001E516CA9|nr:hypothetical protein [Lactobacillus delbrueckii]MCD5515765.1 hypothetical protein [Lactobacillus delbrueckii subsp. lactis]